jgi:hypothetical protein
MRMKMNLRLPLLRAGAILGAVAALAACGLHFGTGIEAKDTWKRSYPVKAGAVLEVRETAGVISLEATDGDTIEVDATRIASASTEEAAKELLKDFTIGETAGPDRVELDSTTQGTSLGLNRSRRVDYHIKVPRSVSVTVKTTNSEVTAQGLGGMFRVEATNAEIRGTALTGGADVTTVNGDMTLEFVKLGEGGVRCKGTNGEIVVTLPASSGATIAAHVTNGAVETQNLTVQASEQSLTRLNATLGGGGPELRLDLTNGEIKIVGK